MGFLLAPLGVAMLFASVVGFRVFYKQDWTGLYEAITGFGLGGSAIALFGRVGGGIYTKARAYVTHCELTASTAVGPCRHCSVSFWVHGDSCNARWHADLIQALFLLCSYCCAMLPTQPAWHSRIGC